MRWDPGGYRFDEPWNSPNNVGFRTGWYNGSVCPSDPRPHDGTRTSYVAVVGEDTLWPGARPFPSRDVKRLRSHKILLIEWPKSDVGWTEPRDLTLEEALRLLPPLGGQGHPSWHPRGLGYVSIGPDGEKFGILGPDVNAERLADMLRVRPRDLRPDDDSPPD